MKRRTAQDLRCYLFASVILFSIIAGFVMSPNNLTTQQTGNSGEDNGKPLTRFAPSYNTPGYVFIDNFSSPLGNKWRNNSVAVGRGATFSTTQKPGFLTIYTPSTNSFQQTGSINNGAYVNATLPTGLVSASSTFTVETKVNYTKTGSSNSYQVGLIIDFPAQKNMLIWGPYQSNKSIGLTYQGGFQTPAYSLSLVPSAYYLRIVKNGTSYYCYHSTDGSNWISDRNYTQSASPKFVGLIVRTYGSSPYPEITANFDYFRISVDAAIDQVIPSLTTLGTGWPATIQAHMMYYYNTTQIGSGYIGLLANGTPCQLQKADSNGWATFSVAFYTVGLRIFTLYAINSSQHNLKPLGNSTTRITWTGYTITVGATDHEGQLVSGATARLQFTGNHTFVKPPQTTNATGYCSFSGVPWGDTGVYSLNVFQRLYNSTHASYYNTTVPLARVDNNLLQPVTLDTTILTVHVQDTNSIPFQGATIGLYNGTGSGELIATQGVNLTAWARLVLPILSVSKPINLTVWYQGSQLYVKINQTGSYQHGYLFFSTNKWFFNVTASIASNKYPTQLSWRYNPVIVVYWDQSFSFSVWLASSGTKIDADQVNCTVGSYVTNFLKNGSVTGNYYVTIPAALVGKIPSGSASAIFTLTINAYPQDPYLMPAPLTIQATIKAVNLTATYSNAISTYWGSSASLWISLSYINGTKFDRGVFSVNLDGYPSSIPFTPIVNGFYNLTSPNAFSLSVGDHTFQLTFSTDNYTLIGISGQIVTMHLSIQSIPTSPIAATQSYLNETLQPQMGQSAAYWNWIVLYDLSYVNAVNGTPISDASVYVTFLKSGQEVLGSIASYNSSTSTYVAEFDTRSFGNPGNYVCMVTASRTGYATKYFSDVLTISWRPVSLAFSSQNYDSMKGLFGGDSSAHVEVRLMDTLSGSPLTGANVSYRWQYGSGNFTENEGGVYVANVYANDKVPVNVYVLTVSVSKLEYQGNSMAVNMQVDFAGGHVVLPIVGVVPLSMFAIILGAVAVAGGIGGLRAYVWATTPYIIKQINKALHAVEKGTSAEPVPELRTRAGTPILLLTAELETVGINLEKAPAPVAEIAEEAEPEEVEAEETDVKPEKSKRKSEQGQTETEEGKAEPEPEKAEAKPSAPEAKEPEVKTEGLEFEPEDLELPTEAEAKLEEPEEKVEEPGAPREEEGSSEKSKEDFGSDEKSSEDQQAGDEDKLDEGGN